MLHHHDHQDPTGRANGRVQTEFPYSYSVPKFARQLVARVTGVGGRFTAVKSAKNNIGWMSTGLDVEPALSFWWIRPTRRRCGRCRRRSMREMSNRLSGKNGGKVLEFTESACQLRRNSRTLLSASTLLRSCAGGSLLVQ